MIVLGISYTGDHDSSAALVRDGELIAAVEQERASRRKHDGAVPLDAIQRCLDLAGIGFGALDAIALPDLPYRFGRDTYLAAMEWPLVLRLLREGRATWRHLVHRALAGAVASTGLPLNVGMEGSVRDCLDAISARFGRLPPLRVYEHHRAHAAAVYLTSGAARAAVITCDGVGGPYTSVAWSAQGSRLHRINAELHPNSLGHFYEDITLHLGLGRFGEGKAMGLAPYGDPTVFAPRIRALLGLDEARWHHYRSADLSDALGFPPRSAEPICSGPYADVAAAAQRALEESMLRIARSVAVPGQILCLGGGVTLNCSANGVLRRDGLATEVWAFPAAGDAGLSVGAALLASADAGEHRQQRLPHAYLGACYTDTEIDAALDAEPRIVVQRSADVATDVAALLAAGHVVGWFQGRAEFGPRALGNRSILADPRTTEMRDRVNRLKGRESWRPLAPAVLLDHAADYFELEGESPFMLFAVPVRAERRGEVPAVVHADGSARAQTVSATQNPRFHALLSAFERATGLPVLINTSFNDEREPMVDSPADAVRCFISCGLDALVLGDRIAMRRDLPPGGSAGADRPTVA